ncbi:radical SAM protein [Pelomyxa schiedti]|nr:radical SAM protein [Pelomyxa schiedti]
MDRTTHFSVALTNYGHKVALLLTTAEKPVVFSQMGKNVLRPTLPEELTDILQETQCHSATPIVRVSPVTSSVTAPTSPSTGSPSRGLSTRESCIIVSLLQSIIMPFPSIDEDVLIVNKLVDEGYLYKLQNEGATAEQVQLQYKRNPLENVSYVIFEYTNLCGFHCHHCHNSRTKKTTVTNLNPLLRSVDVLVQIGVNHFAFIGGEVDQFGDGWLNLTRHIASHREKEGDIPVSVVTSGWFLEQTNFLAAGVTYPDVPSFLRDMKANGVTHIRFSLDSHIPEEHDQNREHPGLFAKVMRGMSLVRECGLEARVSVLVPPNGMRNMHYLAFLLSCAEKMYDFPPDASAEDKLVLLADDKMNMLNNFIDIGSGATENCTMNSIRPFDLLKIPPEQLYCKGFFRPAPTLTIKANGEISLCRVTNAGEGYGNINNHDIVYLLNHLQDSFLYKLHAEKRLHEYIKYLDTNIFGTTFTFPCAFRAVLSMIAKRVHERNIQADDLQAIQQINREVAWYSGHGSEKPEELF